ncbi:MAG: glycosyltransferase family 4 protein, partial [archaeon]|nr:glycosyltransferase family 4 protein [archaeon]
MPKKVAKVNRIHLDTFKNPVLLTLTRSSLRGGMEAYSDYLKKIIPSLTIWSREDIENSPPFNLPFMKEASWSIAYARRVHLERDRPDLILSSGMHGWAFGPTERNIPSLSILHGTFAGLSDTAYSPTNLQYWRMRYAYSFLERKSAQNAHVRVANSPFTQKEVKRYYGLNSRAILPPIDSQN